MHAQPMSLDALLCQMGMILRGGLSCLPDRCGLLSGLSHAPGIIGLSLAPHGLQAHPVQGFLFRR